MATGTGIAAQLGLVAESTWGTAVTVTRFYELVSENLKRKDGRIESKGIRSEQRVLRSADWAPGAQKIEGTVELEMSTLNMALLFKHAMGSLSGASSPFTITPGNKTGLGLTVQVGRPDAAGTVEPHTFAGCKIKSWELSGEAGSEDPIKLKLDMVGKSEVTNVALASASYTSSNDLLHWGHLAVTIGGSAVPVRAFSLKGETPLNDSRYQTGALTIDEPLENGLHEYSGSLTLDYSGLTQYARYTGGTEAAVVFTFTRGSVTYVFTMNARFDETGPEVKDLDVLPLEVPFKCIGTTTDALGITLVATTGESAP